MKVAFFTLGCKVNQYDTQIIENLFLNQNFEIVDSSCKADIYIINSCTVTAKSDYKIRQMAHRFKAANSGAILVLVGCFAQAFGNNFEASSKTFNLFDIVIGNSNKFEICLFVKEFLKNREKIFEIQNHSRVNNFYNYKISNFKHRFRAFVKIEDGCEKSCSYCIIPRARGFVTSKPLDVLKFEIEKLVENGYIEIVLVGINLSSYGVDFKNEIGLIDAVKMVSGIEKVKRIRLGSLEPDLFSEDDIYNLSKIKKFCPNFHLSLQSGSNSVLKRMRRNYDVEQYYNLVSLIFKFFENPSITTDMMVGFPQETELEFLQSLDFIAKVGFLKVHIFPYSRRLNTVAALMQGQLSNFEKSFRVKKMKKVVNFETKKFLKNQVGKVLEVLFEKREQGEVFVGHSKNYCLVKVQSSTNLCGKVEYVKIKESFENFCFGIVLKD